MADVDEPTHDRRRVRQWSVTITEESTRTGVEVLLRWRTFPCAAQHWDGVMSARVDAGSPAITSQEALREVLAGLASVPWEMGPARRRA